MRTSRIVSEDEREQLFASEDKGGSKKEQERVAEGTDEVVKGGGSDDR